MRREVTNNQRQFITLSSSVELSNHISLHVEWYIHFSVPLCSKCHWSSSPRRTSWLLKMGWISCPEKPVTNYQLTPRGVPDELMPQLYRSRSSKSLGNHIYLEWRIVKTYCFYKQEVVVLTKLVFDILSFTNIMRYRLLKRIQRQPVPFDNCRSLYQSFLTASVMHYCSPYRCWKHHRNLHHSHRQSPD
jgi:hypothetical protein